MQHKARHKVNPFSKKNYQTMKEVSNRLSFSQMEEEILQFWRSENIFQKSIDERPRDNSFSFYDGPPFATGLPHYGHLLAGTIKAVSYTHLTLPTKA